MPIQSLTFQDISFSNIRYLQESYIIQIGSVQKLNIESLALTNVSSTSSVDFESAAIAVLQVDLSTDENIEISGVKYQNSSISLVSMPTFLNVPPSPKQINFRNMEFLDSYLVSQVSIIRTQGIVYNLDVTLTFDNLTFDGISFKSRGNLLNLDQQLPTNLTISNSRFRNISQGIINIESANKENNDLLTHVVLKNITADQIQENDASFLNVKQGGRLYISDSSFTSMYIYQNGGFLSGGASSTITTIHNSVFENNSALNGGVFHVIEQSTIKIYSCTITHNFAIMSGVINVAANGQFEIYDSTIHDNHANVNPVSQLLDTAKTSLVSNTEIYSNHALSRESLVREFSSCSKL